jgi:hypothetical protein
MGAAGQVAWVLVQMVRALSWGNHQTAAELTFQSRDEMANVWKADGGREDQMPMVAFSKETVVAVFSGQKTAANHVKIKAVLMTDDKKQGLVLYQESDDKSNSSKVTYPNAVVVVPKTEVPFKFLDIDGTEGKAIWEKLNTPPPQKGQDGK